MLPCLIPFTINWRLPSRRNEIISCWVASQACPHSFFFPHHFSRHQHYSSFWNVPDVGKQGIVTIALKNSPPLQWTHSSHLSSCLLVKWWEDVKGASLVYCFTHCLAQLLGTGAHQPRSWGHLSHLISSLHSFKIPFILVLFLGGSEPREAERGWWFWDKKGGHCAPFKKCKSFIIVIPEVLL